MEELWQLYDNQGQPLAGKGATKHDIYSKALLHAASHVWIWRKGEREKEILVQRRAANKRTWPNRYDISAAGHIDLGEDELCAAKRETEEEIGYILDISELEFIGTHRCFIVAPDKTWTENEIRFLYLLQVDVDAGFSMVDGEVDSVEWKPISTIKQELAAKDLQKHYVPHSNTYFAMLFEALDRVAKPSS